MADVKWIKIVTDIFDDEKMQVIESMPEGDAIALIWFKLLCVAGKTNQSGFLMLTDRIAYTEDMLAAIFRRDVKIVRLALQTFESMGMVEITDNKLCVVNWNKYQNVKGLDDIREQARIRQQEYRDRQRLLTESTEIKNVDKEQERKNKNKSKNALHNVTRNVTDDRFGEFWEAYPKKVGKQAALKSWKRIKVTSELHDKMLAAIRLQKIGAQWQKDNGQYIPNPATWLNQGRWDDEVNAVQGRTGKTVIEQQYNQREYKASDYDELTPEEISEALQYKA